MFEKLAAFLPRWYDGENTSNNAYRHAGQAGELLASTVALLRFLQWKLLSSCVSFPQTVTLHSFISSAPPLDIMVWLSFLLMQITSLCWLYFTGVSGGFFSTLSLFPLGG